MEKVGLENAYLSKLDGLMRKMHRLLAFLTVLMALLLLVVVMFLAQAAGA